MANVIIVCPDVVTVKQNGNGANATYSAECSQPWQTVAAPNTALDPQEFAGFFLGVLISTLTFYFVGVLPIGMFLRFLRQGMKNLL